jgi:hypothetical protein
MRLLRIFGSRGEFYAFFSGKNWEKCLKKIAFYSDLNGRYRGEWNWDEERNIGRGNPAASPQVVDLKKSLRHRSTADGGDTRNHSVPMTREFMEQIHKYILTLCPPDGSTISIEAKRLRIKCLYYLAFSTASWTLWTR